MNGHVHAIAAAMRTVLAGLGDLLLPNLCSGCQSGDVDHQGLCDECNLALLKLVALQYCPRCGNVPGPDIPIRDDGCYACPTPMPRFARIYRLGPHTEPLRNIIIQVKYHRNLRMVKRMGAMLAQAVMASSAESFDVVMSVPMHWRRRIARGCDHAKVLAREIGKQIDLPLGDDLIRNRHTPPQVGLSRARRIANVFGAFSVRDVRPVQGARILLVDDVITTGATANEAARALFHAKAESVHLAVIAKAGKVRPYA